MKVNITTSYYKIYCAIKKWAFQLLTVVRMVFDELWYCRTTMLLWQKETALRILLDMVVLNLIKKEIVFFIIVLNTFWMYEVFSYFFLNIRGKLVLLEDEVTWCIVIMCRVLVLRNCERRNSLLCLHFLALILHVDEIYLLHT